MIGAVSETSLGSLKLFRRGKVRDVYDLGENLLLVATDRVSAFDHVLPTPIPDKGRVLTQLAGFWFGETDDIVANHMISTEVGDLPEEVQAESDILNGRSMLVRKTEPIEVECVVRGYVCGSAWKEYQQDGTVGGEPFPEKLSEFDPLPVPLFTPAVKRHEGHDENISLRELEGIVGRELSDRLKDLSIGLYERGRSYAGGRGLILADTKFEFGWEGDNLILIDELLTPDSSRYWPAETWGPGQVPRSADKQIVRDYLISLDWDGSPPVPGLPEEVVAKVRAEYMELYRRITGEEL